MKIFLASLPSTTFDLIQPLLSTPPTKTKIAYITTAADTYTDPPWVSSDKTKMDQMGFHYDVYDIKNKDAVTFKQDLAKYDCIYVTGGNTFYLLYHIRQSGFDQVIKELIDRGTIYIGGSAGSCIMGPTIEHLKIVDHPELIPQLTDYTALGLVPQLIVPHAGRHKYTSRHEIIRTQWGDRLLFLRDDQVLVVNGDKSEIQTLS